MEDLIYSSQDWSKFPVIVREGAARVVATPSGQNKLLSLPSDVRSLLMTSGQQVLQDKLNSLTASSHKHQ